VAGGEAGDGALTAVRLRQTAGWVLALGLLGGLLFGSGLAVRFACIAHRCPSRDVRLLLDLDALGSLPRLFTTFLFVAVAVLAGRAAARSERPARWWWAVVGTGTVALAAAKAVSVHSAAEQADGRLATLVVGLLLTAIGLPVLWWAGRRWSVPAAGAVTTALAVYAAAALGLDQVSALVNAIGATRVTRSLAIFVEEGGEAAAVLFLLASVSRWLPPAPLPDVAGGPSSRAPVSEVR
jgi:hypothetical protein